MNNYTKQTEQLLALIKENPNLPIVPIVSEEVYNDDYNLYLGRWGSCYISEFLIIDKNDCFEVLWKEDDDVWGVLEKYFTDEEYAAISNNKGREIYENLPWIKAITVYIGAYENE